MSSLLEIDDLTVHFDSDAGVIEAVDGVSLDIRRGEILGLVGESGSGKSVTSFAILRLIRPPGRIVRGAIRIDGLDLFSLSEEEMRQIRGSRVAMVPQSPRTALNPVIPVGRQVARLFELHRGATAAEARRRTLDMLQRVGIAEPDRRARQYAHQLSGGTCQRIMIAMALATSPELLLADEPTTGLDVSIAARILELLRDLGRTTGAAILLITHDMGVVAGTCDRVAVIHAGQLVETAPVRSLFRNPAHPYTQALVRSTPRIDRDIAMAPIPGAVPSLLGPPAGCRYVERCPWSDDLCHGSKPRSRTLGADHSAACFGIEEGRVPAPAA
jgi:oligopeptide/dipeptide ABC transporter ATP-binding protein